MSERIPSKLARYPWIDHLRAFITLLVVAHHSALAYCTFSTFHPEAYILSTAPVVDRQRWAGFDLLVSFQDVYFMALMFFLSGLFVRQSLKKKGEKGFIRERMRRLGIPLIAAILVIVPLAYIPSYILAKGHFAILPFLRDYIFTESWPVGPSWFIFLLLVFNLFVILIPCTVRRYAADRAAWITRSRTRLFISFLLLAIIAYAPLSARLGAYFWWGIGPFDVQVNRLPLYAVFFFAGVLSGPVKTDRFSQVKFRTAIYWLIAAGLTGYLTLQDQRYPFPAVLLFPVSAVLSGIALALVFRIAANTGTRLWRFLSANAYGIYLVHYPLVTWMQYGLADAPVYATLKFLVVLIVSVPLSAGITALLRKVVVVRSIL